MAIDISEHRAALVFRTIEITRMEGVRDGFGIDSLSPGINLIYGPNGIGKSRTAIALQSLIWHDASSGRAEIVGTYHVSGDDWRIDLDAGRVRYQRDGVPGGAPKFSKLTDTHRDRYLLTLQDLLRIGNRDFARQIQREAAGGYDLARVSDEMRTRSGRPTSAINDLQTAETEVTKLRREHQQLRQEEMSLAGARKDLDGAIAAGERIRMLEAAQEYADAREQRREAQVARDAYEDPIGSMSGKEHQDVQELQAQLREQEARRTQVEREIEQHQQDLEETGFTNQSPPATMIPTLKERLDQVRQCEIELDQSAREIAEAASLVESHRSRLGSTISDDQLAALDGDGLRQLSNLTRDYWNAENDYQAQQAVYAWIGSIDTPQDVDRLRRGVDLLSRFLQTERVGPEILSPHVRWTLLGAAFVIALESVLLAVEASAAFLAMAVIAVPVVLVAFRKSAPDVLRGDEIRVEYGRLGLPAPADWSRDHVISAIEEVQRELATVTLDHEKQLRWNDLSEKRVNAKLSRDALDERRRELLHQYGVTLDDHDPESLRHMASSLEHWRSATDAVAQAESRRATSERRRQEHISTINADLVCWGMPEAQDGSEASASIDVLSARVSQADRSRMTMRRDTASLEQDIQPRIEGLERRLAEIYTSLDLTVGDEHRLRELSNSVEACRGAQRALDEAEVVLKTWFARLSDAPEYADLSHEEIERQMLEASSDASRREEIQERISTIEARLQQARQKTTLEAAVAAESEAVDALGDSRNQAYEAAAASRLLAFIQDQNDERNRPAVFGVADEYFRLFTTGAYTLGITDGNAAEFLAIDTATGRFLELSELSSGTRVQLLLAVRLAFIESSEHGPQLPLILDETLGNTDDLRATTIIDAAIQIARRGRQVLYFTAQRDEIAKWHARLDDQPDSPTWTVFDLALIRGDARAGALSDLDWDPAIFEPTDIPDDAGYERLYTILDVPAVDMWAEGVDGVDLWYLIPEVEPLAALRARGVKTWGQYQALRRTQHLDGIAIGDIHDRATARAQVIETVCREWRRGRSIPVTKEFLHSSDFISDRFRDEVDECAERHGWNGAALILALTDGEVSRFLQSNVDGLEESLREHGYITDAEPVPHELIRARAFSVAAAPIEQGVLESHEVDRLLLSMPGELAMASRS